MSKDTAMNKQIEQLALECGAWHQVYGNRTFMIDEHFDIEKFAELIVAKCVAQCEQVAAEADAMTKSEFVTDAGRMLHEGMWGGAKNCSGQIKEHFFGVEE